MVGQEEKKSRFSKRLLILLVAILVLVVATASPGFYFFKKYRQAKALLENPGEAAKIETQAVVDKVGRLMELPDEEPTLATVVDAEALQDQPFFINAQNDDQILIYPEAQKAILYRPSINKVIEVAPITLGDNQELQSVSLVVYNGTDSGGLAQEFETAVQENISNIEVRAVGNAANNYDTTLVIDLAGDKAEVAQQLAQLLQGEVAQLPEGESRPETEADILVIVGSDYISNQPFAQLTQTPQPPEETPTEDEQTSETPEEETNTNDETEADTGE